MKNVAIGIMKTGVILGVGAGLPGGAGVANMAASLPTMGTIGGAGMSINALKGLGKK